MTTAYDVIVIGSGHNGLVCGSYLAMSGLRTLVLERRNIVGGAAVTEEFAPGFRASRFSYVMSLLHPRIIIAIFAKHTLSLTLQTLFSLANRLT